MANHGAKFRRGRFRGQRNRRLLARLAGNPMGSVLLQPRAAGDKVGELARQSRHQLLPGRRRQIGARQKRSTDRGQIAIALDQAVKRKRRKICRHILGENTTSRHRADLSNGRSDRARQPEAAGDDGLDLRRAGRDRVDEIGVDQERRTFQHRFGDLELVAGERKNHRRWRRVAGRERFGERSPHQRRGIVEQHEHGALRRRPIIRGQVGVQISARQRAGGIGPITGGCGSNPVQEMPNDHVLSEVFKVDAVSASCADRTIVPTGLLTKRSP